MSKKRKTAVEDNGVDSAPSAKRAKVEDASGKDAKDAAVGAAAPGAGTTALECAVCLEPFHPTDEAKIPRLLTCGHSVCASCLPALDRKDNVISCPLDRLPTAFSGNIDELKKNFALIELMDRLFAQASASVEHKGATSLADLSRTICSACGKVRRLT